MENGLLFLLLRDCGRQGDFALPGEFDGVADQIDQHLPQAAGVAPDKARNVRRQVA
ncbi:hypothetical protein SDC9_200400 [bioreactor metagenome]|uniref:Uncharacterized protein n=1 Tax=bioreactor metagenome TaxID=1076179 RepID=A0A645IN48_9ZZZZ